MKKTSVVLIVVIIVIALVGVGAFFLLRNNKSSSNNQASNGTQGSSSSSSSQSVALTKINACDYLSLSDASAIFGGQATQLPQSDLSGSDTADQVSSQCTYSFGNVNAGLSNIVLTVIKMKTAAVSANRFNGTKKSQTVPIEEISNPTLGEQEFWTNKEGTPVVGYVVQHGQYNLYGYFRGGTHNDKAKSRQILEVAIPKL